MTSSHTPIVILGAGVIGLTTAHRLVYDRAYQGPVTIVARDLPEDLDAQSFSSPWAGANWSPIGGVKEDKMHRWERDTYNTLYDMQSTGQVKIMPSRTYYDYEDVQEELWQHEIVRNFRRLASTELPDGIKSGVEYETVAVNPAKYLPWLKEKLLAKGVTFIRRKIQRLDDLYEYTGHDGIAVNCTALGSRSILGIEDPHLYPIRGQTVTVNAPEIKGCHAVVSRDLDANGEITYIIPRPSESHSVLLGGTYQAGNWDTSIDLGTAARILERCSKLEPSLADPASSARVVSHQVGLRPARVGGPRVEREQVPLPTQSKLLGPQHHRAVAEDGAARMRVVHAYGFGAVGYQNSWGASKDIVDLVLNSWE